MNKTRRAALQRISNKLEDLKEELETIESEEQDYYDNIPESFQGGDKGDTAQAAIDTIQNAISSLDDAISYISEVE